jgi:pyrimidine deaminase RibD-like protein
MKMDDKEWLLQTLALSKKCIPTATAFCVGAIIVDNKGSIVSTGYSRENDPHKHAEEIAIEKALEKKVNLKEMTLYSSLEPCGERLSGRKTCTEWIIQNRIKRVVFGAHEPAIFVKGKGEEILKHANVETIFLDIGNPVV